MAAHSPVLPRGASAVASPSFRGRRTAVAGAAALCGLLAVPAAVHAQAASQPLKEVVTITGSLEDPQSTTGSAYALPRQELQKFEATNVNAILRTVPGVHVREEDGMGTFPNIGIRAGSSGRSGRIST